MPAARVRRRKDPPHLPEATRLRALGIREGVVRDGPLDEISFLIGRAYYNYVTFLERVLADHALDKIVCPGMGHILFALFEQDGRIIKDLAGRTRLACSTLTGMLDRMERCGLIKRERDPSDGRAVRISLTPLGRSIEPRCQRVVADLNGVLQNGMSAREVEDLKRLMARMVDAMRADEERRRDAWREELRKKEA